MLARVATDVAVRVRPRPASAPVAPPRYETFIQVELVYQKIEWTWKEGSTRGWDDDWGR